RRAARGCAVSQGRDRNRDGGDALDHRHGAVDQSRAPPIRKVSFGLTAVPRLILLAIPAKVLALAETLSRAIPEREPKADREDPNYKWWLDPDDPRTKLKEAWRRDVEAARADERENAAQEIERLKALVAERDAEIEDLRAACAKPVGPARPAALPAESTP